MCGVIATTIISYVVAPRRDQLSVGTMTIHTTYASNKVCYVNLCTRAAYICH